MPTHTTLKGNPQVGEALLSDNLEANLFSFFNWGLLTAGGYFNVNIPTSGAWGGAAHRLRLANDPNYDAGQVWEGFRKDWVWETGVDRALNEQPIRVSGVFIGGNFSPSSGVGNFAHKVDYPNGRVVFDTAIDTDSVVTCEYSYRLFQFYTADAPWFKQIQLRSFRVDDSHFLQEGSGSWDILAQSRFQLPAVVIEAVPGCEAYGTQIGGGDTFLQDVVFHVLAEDRWYFKWMHDALMRQFEKRIIGFDKNLMLSREVYPLDYDGSPRESGLMYPDLVQDCTWRQIRFERLRSSQQPSIGEINYCTVRLTTEVDLPIGV